MRALRLRRAWRQEDLGRRAGLSRDAVHRAETRGLPSLTIGALERLVGALEADLVVEIRWRGAQLDSLVDRLHAAMVTLVARRLERSGWLTWAEVSFNHFGDRGRCDLVAWHPGRRVLILIEVKTRVGNLQELLGALDVKSRLGSVIADQLGLGRPQLVVPGLVLLEHGANRRLLRRHQALFRSFDVRGRAAFTWLRQPVVAVGGLLWFELPDSDQGRTKRPRPARDRPPAG
jgi:transcriptional regulator with XRE-family HTH domain